MIYVKSKQFISYARNANENSVIVAEIYVDTTSDLPTSEQIDGYTLFMGSIAYVITTGEMYVLDSGGRWHVSGGSE